ncbi:MAG TPA: type IV secretory system conjugative DNA transfer family protein, partial [Ktedonobacterales bacterium]|nr:type IV secretory system conjugative DNA transfer family protein [Ktedonobacterales bacterium]
MLDHVVAAYRQHALASGNGFVAHRVSARRAAALAARWPRHVRRSSHLLNARELAALWHLPAGDAQVPLLERTRARTLLAPASPLARGYRLGESTSAGHTVPVCLPPEALRRNALLIAKTGKGKSSLLLHLARAQVESGDIHRLSPVGGAGAGGETGGATQDPSFTTAERAGLVVVDPHGDLIAAFLGLVPSAARERVVLVDLADTAYPVALNPLDVVLGRDRDRAVESLLQILAQIWARFWGPRMQNALEYALKTLYEANEAFVAADPQEGPDHQYTLLDVAPLLSAPGFREEVLHTVHDPSLLAWWNLYYKPLDTRLKVEIINPVLTKLASFSGSRVARRIVGQGRSTLDLPEIVREGRLLLVNTALGVVGAETATLVGATLLGALQFTLEEQARLAAGQRRRLLVLVDEFQTIRGVDYGAMLAELRKFGGTFALATQALAHLDALDPTLRPTVLANVDALYVFATSAEDARALVHELDDAVEVADIINQDDFTCYAKLALDGRRLPPFTLALDPPPLGDSVLAEQIRGRARTRYGRPVQAVEDDLARAAQRYQPSTDRVASGSSVGASHAVTQAVETAASGSGLQRSPSGRGRYGQRQRGPRATSAAPMDELWAGVFASPTVSTPLADTAQAHLSALVSEGEPAS